MFAGVSYFYPLTFPAPMRGYLGCLVRLNCRSTSDGLLMQVSFAALHDMLSGMRVGTSGRSQLMILSQQGQELANSIAPVPLAATDPTKTQVTVSYSLLTYGINSQYAPLSTALRQLSANTGAPYDDLSSLPPVVDYTFTLDGETWLALATTSVVQPNMQLVTLTVVPQSDFTGQIDQGRKVLLPVFIVASTLSALKYVPWFLKRCPCSVRKGLRSLRCCGRACCPCVDASPAVVDIETTPTAAGQTTSPSDRTITVKPQPLPQVATNGGDEPLAGADQLP